MIIKYSISALFILLIVNLTNAQVSCTNATERTLTSYTTSSQNDSLFIICAGQTATLVATPPSGIPGWNFTWQQFNVTGNMWNPLTSATGLPSSTQTNLQPGGYRVVITDGTNTEVGTYVVWVSRIDTNPSVSVNQIPAGCGNVQLTGQVNNGTITPYYNPPSTSLDPSSMLIVDETTEITVCYTGTHTWVSDLGFYLRGPVECGYPIVTLSPNPGANGQGSVCNSNDNFNGLCFSTASTNNFNPCVPNWDLDGLLPVNSNYTGTYGSYGPNNNQTPINWTALHGCTASSAGWAVQIYDCIGLDFGTLSGASLSFSGTSEGGNPVTYTYQTPSGFSSAINDNSCTPQLASIFEVPAPPPSPIYFTYGYEWTANPPFTIPNSTSSLNIMLSPGPSIDTEFTLSITGNNPGAVCGGTAEASRTYDFQEGLQSTINNVNTTYCLSSATVILTATPSGGTWTGTGITNASNGTFSPSSAGIGEHVITYTPSGSCNLPATITLTVSQNIPIVVTPVAPVCVDASSFQLQVDGTGGTWSGTGIINASTGIFDPAVAGEGNHVVQYHIPGICEAIGITTVSVVSPVALNISAPTSLCENAQPVILTANVPGGTWSGAGVNAQSGLFNPALAGSGNNSITYSFNNGCQNSTSVLIQINAIPAVNAGPDVSICTGENTTLTATGASSYSWLPEAGLSNPSSASTNAAPTSTTTYTVTGTLNGCSATDIVTIIVNPLPNIITSGPHTICPNESVVLQANGLTNYSWNNSSSLSADNIPNPQASPTSTTIYTVSGTDSNGCYNEAQINVTVIQTGFTLSPSEGLSPLEVFFTNHSVGDIFYWDFGNGETDITELPSESTSTIYYEDGLHTVTLQIEENGTSCQVSHDVFVYSSSRIEIIPNIVTADGSGQNDTFRIQQRNLRSLEIVIFNRYGNQVGIIDKPYGTWSARDFSDGTYYYVLKAEGMDGIKYDQAGHFTVTR